MAGGESSEPPCLRAAGLCRVPQAVVLCSANSASELRSRERRDTARRHCPPPQLHHCGQPLGLPRDCQLRSSAQHHNAEWAAPSRGNTHPANTGCSHLQGEGRRDPGPVQVQTRASWPGFSPPTHLPAPPATILGSRTALGAQQVTRIPVYLIPATWLVKCWDFGAA